MVLAMETEKLLRRLKCEQISTASNVADALSILEHRPIQVALLDVNLGGEASFPIAETLKEKGIPFVMTTGYSRELPAPEWLLAERWLTKPVREYELVAALRAVTGN